MAGRAAVALSPHETGMRYPTILRIAVLSPLVARWGNKPAVIVWADQDPGFTPQELALFQKTFQNEKTIHLREANHFFFEDSNDLVVKTIRQFAPAAKGERLCL